MRPWRPDDAAALAAGWADPDIARFTAVPGDAGPERAARWLAGADERWRRGLALDLAVTAGDPDGPAVGEVGIGPVDWARGVGELGWWLLAAHRGGGHAARALALVVGWATAEARAGRLGLEHLVARVDRANPASAAVARRAGLAHRGVLDDGRDLFAVVLP